MGVHCPHWQDWLHFFFFSCWSLRILLSNFSYKVAEEISSYTATISSFQYSTMSPVLQVPFDIITQIIDVVGENEDKDLLKKLSLVSHSFLQICSKYLFATIELGDAFFSSERGFVKLLKSRPEVVKYIRRLTYKLGDNNPSFADEDRLLSSMLPNFLRSIHHLNYLIITSRLSQKNPDWKELDSSMTLALLHLMHLPSINRIDLSLIENFPLSSLIPCVNLLQLEVLYMGHAHEDDDVSFEIVPSEVMPKLREFSTTGSSVLARKLLHAKMQDGRPAFNPMNLRRLSLYPENFEDKSSIRYLLQNAKSLEELCLQTGLGHSIVGLHDILSPTAYTLKVLHLTSSFFVHRFTIFDVSTPARQLCEELEAIAGRNVLEALSYTISVGSGENAEDDGDDFIGTMIQKVGEVLVKPGWSALRLVSFTVFRLARSDRAKSEAVQSLTDKCLSHISKLESVQIAFKFSCEVRII